MMELINKLWFLRRDLISDGYDQALAYLSRKLPLTVHQIPSGTKCWTWTVPEKWTVKEAYIENLNGERVLDLKNHPLYVMSYSLPVDKLVSRQELLNHLYTRPDLPQSIPYEYSFYEKKWGFCLEHNRLASFKDEQYRVVIKSNFSAGSLKVGECLVKGKSEQAICLAAHLCHPAMVNDDLTGVAVLAEIAKELLKKNNYFTYRCLFLPETIGSIAYLSQNESIIPKIKYGIFLEMLGNKQKHALQQSWPGNSQIDKIAQYVMKKNLKDFQIGAFRQIVSNDEMVFNGPGINIPMISISRYPYPEHHTSLDSPAIITEQNLLESKKIIEDILEILEKNYTPKRTFKGPLFLSSLGLWVDWRKNFALNKKMEKIMLNLEGNKTIFDIAQAIEMDFNDVLSILNQLFQHGFIKKIDR